MTRGAYRAAPPARRDRAGGVGGFVGLVASLAAVAFLVLAALLWLVATLTLDAGRWLGALRAGGAYEQARAAISEQLVHWSNSQPAGHAKPLGPLDQGDVDALVVALAPPAWIRSQAETVVPVLLAGVAAGGEVHAVVSLEALRARLAGPELAAAIQARMTTWPACTTAQESQLLTASPPRCRPTSVSPALVAPVIAGIFTVVATSLPSSVDLAVPGTMPGAGVLASAGVLDALRLAAAAGAGVPTLLTLAVASLLLAAVARGLRPARMARAVGVPLLLAGIVLAVASILVDGLLQAVVGAVPAALAQAGVAPTFAATGQAVARSVVAGAGGVLLGPAAALIAGGVLLLAVSLVLPGNGTRGQAPPPSIQEGRIAGRGSGIA